MTRLTVLTGERPLGQTRSAADIRYLTELFSFQETHRCFYMIADYQAFAARQFDPIFAEARIRSLLLDYLAAGFDPGRSSCFLQSDVPQLFELAAILSNLVTVRMLQESVSDGEAKNGELSAGFIGYPISQAADILLLRAALVPAGVDQRRLVEFTQEVSSRFNKDYACAFVVPEGHYIDRSQDADADAAARFEAQRAEVEAGTGRIAGILRAGGSEARVEGQRTLETVKKAIGSAYGGILP